MDGPAHFRQFAAYNAWANTRLYDAAATLSPEELARDCGAFFGSLLGTLNHLLVGDLIWMSRFDGAGPVPDRLDAILHADLPPLRAARKREDARIRAYCDGLTPEQVSGTMTYRTIVNPAEVTQPRAAALAHFFNHQTHHRGQAHALLTHLGYGAPSFDLLIFQREHDQ
ncbi:MAG: DinB family protein [Caulobacterales bacterium]|nr:DinB family protein [Caulobacterales bacterium]